MTVKKEEKIKSMADKTTVSIFPSLQQGRARLRAIEEYNKESKNKKPSKSIVEEPLKSLPSSFFYPTSGVFRQKSGRLDDEKYLKQLGVRGSKFQLHYACADGDLQKVRKLIAQRFDINANYQSAVEVWTPLHAAVYGFHLAVVKLLIESGARKEKRAGLMERTPLMYAVLGASKPAHVEVVRCLVESGAKIDVRDKADNTLIHLLAEKSNSGIHDIAIFNLLMEHNIKIDELQPLIKTARAAGNHHIALLLQQKEDTLKQEFKPPV